MRILFSTAKPELGPAIFIDRDGVINHLRENNYVLEWPQFVFVYGIGEALKSLSSLQLPMIVISNQAAVGRGLLSEQVLEDITERMYRELVVAGAPLTAVYYCTHRREEACLCRKPNPGLLRQAAADFHIDLGRSVFIGDADTDVQAARAAGCQPILFGSPSNRATREGQGREVPVAESAAELFRVTEEALRTADTNYGPGRNIPSVVA